MTTLLDTFTSTGEKFFAHQEAMQKLRNGRGQPITCHIMATDVCQHTCAFCSVQARAGDILPFDTIIGFIDILRGYGLKAVILSGGGNPILYRCMVTGKDFNDVVDAIHERGLEIGLITNGMPMKEHVRFNPGDLKPGRPWWRDRTSWKTVTPETLDKLAWVRISMAGLDHVEREVYVPDIDPSRTALGFSYVAHDVYDAPEDPHHGKVSTKADLLDLGVTAPRPAWTFESRIGELTSQIAHYVLKHRPRYVRLLPNCLEPPLIAQRCAELKNMADGINSRAGREVVFVQHKPPKAPRACYLGYIHPVLAPSGYVMPCDSHCLNESAGHQLGGEPWRICHWSEVAKLYEQPVHSLIANPSKTCPGCVFSHSNEILDGVVDGSADLTPLPVIPDHVNFV